MEYQDVEVEHDGDMEPESHGDLDLGDQNHADGSDLDLGLED